MKIKPLFLSLNIKPKSKGRPRFGNGHAYTPKSTREYEDVLGWAAKAAGAKPLPNPCKIDLTATFKQPMRNCPLYCTKRPDIDNFFKIVSDALNGIAWQDDAQIIEATIRKQYGTSDKIEITVYYL